MADDNDDDFADEEAQMAKLRASSKYKGLPKREPKPIETHRIISRDSDDEADQPAPEPEPAEEEQQPQTKAGRKASRREQQEKQHLRRDFRLDDGDGSGPVVVGEHELAGLGLPTSFGGASSAAGTAKPANPIDGTRRNVIGPRRPGQQQQPGPQRPAPAAAAPSMVGPPWPSSSAAAASAASAAAADDSAAPSAAADDSDGDEFVGPPRPAAAASAADGEEEGGVAVEEEEDANFYEIPMSHEILLKGHTKMISALAWDPAGGRLLSGSFDYTLRMWDFAGMDAGLRSFRSIQPLEGNQIHSIQFSPTGDRFLVATGGSQCKLYDRDGQDKGTTIKGDMYLADMNNTKGHVAAIHNAFWHPLQKETFASASSDGTVRVWNVETMAKKQVTVIKTKDKAGRKTGVSYGSYTPDGSTIAAGCADGSLQLFPAKGPYHRPSLLMREAHTAGNELTCVAFANDNFTAATRGMDDTMRVWDIRNLKAPLTTFADLPNFGQTNCIFSPDQRLILTGTAIRRNEGGSGLLVMFDRTLLQRVKQVGIAPQASVVSTLWHPRLNQLAVGTTSGSVHVLYDPRRSQKGALLAIVKRPRQKDPNDFEPARPILTPHALPMYYETPGTKRKEARDRYNPSKYYKPDTDTSRLGGKDGKLGSSITRILMDKYIQKDSSRDEDPREALLKYAEAAEKEPLFFGGAYAKTQPKTVFDTTDQTTGRAKPEKSGQE